MSAAYKLLFLCPGRFSFGELQNAIVVAQQLPKPVVSEFIVSEQYLDLARRSGIIASPLASGPTGAQALLQQISRGQPDAIVVADHHLFSLEKSNLSLESIVELNIPIVAFDSLCLGPSSTTLVMALSQLPKTKSIHRWFAPETIVPQIPDAISIIRPVPVAGLGRPEDAFDLYDGKVRPRRSRETVFESLGIDPESDLIVMAQSGWANAAYGLLGLVSPGADSDTYMKLRRLWFHELFLRVGRKVTILDLSARPGVVDRIGNVNFMSLSYQPMDDFTDILAAADLYMTDNLTSGAMAKAASLGTAVLALVNDRNKRSDDKFSISWFAKMTSLFPDFDFPFLVNPFGWVKELQPLLHNNPYLQATPRAEIYDLDALAETVIDQLQTDDLPATRALAGQVDGLPNASEILGRRLAIDFDTSGKFLSKNL